MKFIRINLNKNFSQVTIIGEDENKRYKKNR